MSVVAFLSIRERSFVIYVSISVLIADDHGGCLFLLLFS